jgi:hypothetical protein
VELTGQFEQLRCEQTILMRALRALLALLILVLAMLSMESALSMPDVTEIFHLSLPGEPLPMSSRIVSSHPAAFVTSAIIIGLAGLGLLLTGKAPIRPFVAAVVVAGLLFVQWQFVSCAW